ncbi:hypothetical protein, partial [uncultured Muribaculum sp.]
TGCRLWNSDAEGNGMPCALRARRQPLAAGARRRRVSNGAGRYRPQVRQPGKERLRRVGGGMAHHGRAG